MADKFMVINKVEDYVYEGKVVGRTIYDKGGNKQNIKKGQGGALEKRWEELDAGVGRALKLEMSEYQGHPFVAAFEWVENKFVEEAQKQVEDKTINTRDRSVCLSYSKDLVIGDKIDIDNIFEWADKLYSYIIGGEIKKRPPVAVADETTETSRTISIEKTEDPRLTRMREYVKTLGWTKANKGKFNDYIQRNFLRKAGLEELSDEELTTLEAALKAMAEMK